jgi:hypothetical protein
MRCDEVIRELAAPTGEGDRAAIADHLAGCAACADWARRAEGLDRLWDATRPTEPSAEAWDTVWAKIAATLPCPASAEEMPTAVASPSRNGVAPKILVHPGSVPTGPRTRGRTWRFAAVALVGLAQAAAILVALGLAWRTPPRPDGQPRAPELLPVSLPQAVRWEVDVEYQADVQPGSLPMIRLGQQSGRVEDRTPPEMNLGADMGMEMANVMESLATPPVAAR